MNEIVSVVEKQLVSVIHSWDVAVESYQNSLSFWRDAQTHVRQIKEEKRFIDSFYTVPWSEIIKPNTVALDVGCGSGWLSALLSKYKDVSQVYALDSSRTNLTELLPHVVKILEGDISKIQPVIGLFDRLDVLERKFNLVVASAALHHSTDIRNTLHGIYNILADDGVLVLLNEFPSSKLRYGYRIVIGAIRALRDLGMNRFPKETPMFSSSGILYNRTLGDWTYCLEQWSTFLKEAGFSVKFIPLNYSHKDQEVRGWRRENFVNFICRKSS
jgi:ubiquinone/menaquinone biosynthesis C-methylase UbiE